MPIKFFSLRFHTVLTNYLNYYKKTMGKSSDSKKHSKKSDSDSSDSSHESKKARKKAKRLKRKEEKLTEKLRKIEKKRLKKIKKKAKRELAAVKNGKKIVEPSPPIVVNNEEKSANVPIGLMEQSKSMAPMTKEEWEKRQSQVRRVLDEESGRYRLIKGDGEVLEEIVSQKRHREINQQATQSDGAFFQAKTTKR